MLTGDRRPPTSHSGMPTKKVFFRFDIDLFLLVWTPASVVTGVERERDRDVWEGGEGRVQGHRQAWRKNERLKRDMGRTNNEI
jgi:hypothetical protein